MVQLSNAVIYLGKLIRPLRILLITILCASGDPAVAASMTCLDAFPSEENLPAKANKPKILETYGPSPWGKCRTASLFGRISAGDGATVRKFFSNNYPVLSKVYLVSPGGSVRDAMEIGLLFRKYLVEAHAPLHDNGWGFLADICVGEECVCASSCALIWFGGGERWGDVGLHRPTILDDEFAASDAITASNRYKAALEAIESYLLKMEAPRSAIEAMIATDSSEIHWLHGTGLRYSPSIAEWQNATCTPFTEREGMRMAELARIRHKSRPLTSTETQQFKELSRRSSEHGSCVRALHRRHRLSVGAPD